MNDSTQSNLPILSWPFYAVWRLLTFVLNVIGRLVSALLGIGLMIAGVAITLSVVGATPGHTAGIARFASLDSRTVLICNPGKRRA